MDRGVKTLEAIVADVRMESGRSPDRNFSQDEYPAIAHLVKRTQERLYWDHNWAFLKIDRFISLQAGLRYYDAPEDLNFERIINVYAQEGGLWNPIERGIGADEYNIYNSDSDMRQDPALKWDIKLTGAEGATQAAGEQIEIWPIPITSDYQIRFEGFANLHTFVGDDDVCTLDPLLLTLFVAAELLARDQRADAPAKLQAANRLYSKMKGAGDRMTPNNSFSMAGRESQPPLRGAPRIIVVRG